MAVYNLFRGITVTQTAPTASGNQIVGPESNNNPNAPAPSHAFSLTVAGAVGATATVQPVGSNDGVSFVNYGPAFSATIGPGVGPAIATQAGTVPYDMVGGYVTSISGTGAAATLQVSA